MSVLHSPVARVYSDKNKHNSSIEELSENLWQPLNHFYVYCLIVKLLSNVI